MAQLVGQARKERNCFELIRLYHFVASIPLRLLPLWGLAICVQFIGILRLGSDLAEKWQKGGVDLNLQNIRPREREAFQNRRLQLGWFRHIVTFASITFGKLDGVDAG